jgi:hypothetical protein
MNAIKPITFRQRRHSQRLEIRYERSFLLDLRQLEPGAFCLIKQFVFEEFAELSKLPDLPSFHKIGSSEIFYRFTLDRYFISLELTGQLVKFLRVIPIPEV